MTRRNASAGENPLWGGTRIVVIDTETTGRKADSRIIEIALEIVERGVVLHSWSSLVDPGLPFIGATEIHGLTAEDLVGAPSFFDVARDIRVALGLGSGQTVYLAGHRVGFDAARLFYEFDLIGDPLEEGFRLLDTQVVAPAAGLGSSTATLADYAISLGLTNPAAHEAQADAALTRTVILRSIETLASQGVTSLDAYSKPAVKGASWARSGLPPVLTPEHQVFHDMSLLTPASMRRALDGCLSLLCPELDRRINDGVINANQARAASAWARSTMRRTDLTRQQRGLVAAGFVHAERTLREMTRKPSATVTFERALAFLSEYDAWTKCSDPRDLCDECAEQARPLDPEWDEAEDGDPERKHECRFVRVPRSALFVALYNNLESIEPTAVHKFLYGDAIRPLGATAWFTKVHTRIPAAALSVAGACLRVLRTEGGTDADAALVAAKALWDGGNKTPAITYWYAALLEDKDPHGPEGWLPAIEVCDEGLAAANGAEGWDRVISKRARLNSRVKAADRELPEKPYNTREPRRLRIPRAG